MKHNLPKHAHSALWVIMVVLLILWGFGILAVGNQAIHLLLVVVIVLFVVQALGSRKEP